MTCQIVYHNGNCLNTKKAFSRACVLCIESCPHQAISEFRQLDAKQCTECGVCMAVCPSDGFVDRTLDKLQDYFNETQEIVLNCPQALPLGFEIPCLGIFDRDRWITLMLWAKTKSATIYTGVCAECEDRPACAASVKVFKQIHNEWLEHPSFEIRVRPDQGSNTSAPVSASAPKQAVSLRSIAGWRQKGLNKVEEWLPGLTADETYEIPKSRQWLIKTLEQFPDEKIPFPALSITDTCTSCGVCSAICPQGALKKREETIEDSEDNAKEDQIRSLKLILEPQKCVQCLRCVEICQQKALTLKIKFLSHHFLTGKVLIHEGSPLYCRECGKRIFDNTGLCLVCSTNDPSSRGNFFR